MNNTIIQTLAKILGVILIGALGAYLHNYFVSSKSETQINAFSTYLFFTISTIFIITIIELTFKILPDKVVYAFLIGTFLKIGFFTLIFFGNGLLDVSLSFNDRLTIIIPLLVFLFVEVIAVVLTLKRT